MFFVRIFKHLGFMVRMVGTTIIDIIPFLIFICMFILYFALISRLTEVDWDPKRKTYPDLKEPIIHVLQNYRNSIGDISVPTYASWIAKFNTGVYKNEVNSKDGYKTAEPQMSIIVMLVWGFWFLNQFISLIILLNFLVAVISESYEKINVEHEMYTFMYRA